jgi:RimJ/RimL family protein N-acetyltransferase
MAYGMPSYYYHENIVHFAAFKNHIGLYPTPDGVEGFETELRGYTWSKGAIQFPVKDTVPMDLIKRITEYRMARSKKITTPEWECPMIGMELVPGIQIRLLEKRHAREFFAFIEKGRANFEEWIPFVSKTKSLEQTEAKIGTFLEMFKNGTGYFWCLWDKKRIIGLILIKDINEETKSAEIGYMIDKDFEGQGLIRKSCELMIEYIFTDLGMSKIACAAMSIIRGASR